MTIYPFFIDFNTAKFDVYKRYDVSEDSGLLKRVFSRISDMFCDVSTSLKRPRGVKCLY